MKADIFTLHKPDILTLRRHFLANSLRRPQSERTMREAAFEGKAREEVVS
jgi:hypothetical protein